MANYKNVLAKKEDNERKILSVCPNCPNTSGIYFLLREENGFKFGYIGQAKNLLRRIASHLSGFQYIDLSIKKHGLYHEAENPTGYKICFLEFNEDVLNQAEQFYIRKYANAGYQMRNVTTGSQGEGKKGFDNAKHPKGYHEGLTQGYKNAQKEAAHLFSLHLDYSTKSQPPNKNQQKALEKFKKFLEVDQNGR